jgi:transposase
MGRRVYSREFKVEAVRLIKERGVSIGQASKDLGVHVNTLRVWVRDLEEDPEQAFPGRGRMKADDAEVARLRRELAKTRTERDILKKAIAYFTKEQK